MKRYMAYSFGTLWTVILAVALVGALIHQIQFQSSPGELNLNHQIRSLQTEIQQLGESIHGLEQEQLELLANPYYE